MERRIVRRLLLRALAVVLRFSLLDKAWLTVVVRVRLRYCFDARANKSNLRFDMDIESELACVAFDETHYINDKWVCECVCKHNIVNSDSLKSLRIAHCAMCNVRCATSSDKKLMSIYETRLNTHI